MKTIAHAIYDHPFFGAISGSSMSCFFYYINIPKTTEILELVGATIKDVGICAGTIVAVASLVSYAQKNWFGKKNGGSDKKGS